MVKKSEKNCETVWKEKKLASDNYMELSFDAIPENEGFARVVVAAFMAQLDPLLEEVDDVKTAVSEAVTNCIIHGYGYSDYNKEKEGKEENENRMVHMECFRCQNELYVLIEDTGIGIDDVKQAMEPLFTTKPDMERSGMGFAFMEAFMDELYVESQKNMGTKVYMSKRIGKK